MEDGEKYINEFFKTSNEHNKDLDHIHAYIHDSFVNLSCCLLPPPGNISLNVYLDYLCQYLLFLGINVTTGKKNGPDYDGNHKEMNMEFKSELIKIIEYLLCPKNLVIKKINNEALTSAKYLQYVDLYFKMFYSEQLPKPQAVYLSTLEQHFEIVVNSCFEEYTSEVKSKQCFINNIEQIPIFQEMLVFKPMLKYNELVKMGKKDLYLKFKEVLILKIKEDYEKWSNLLAKKILLDNMKSQNNMEIMNTKLSNLRKEYNKLQKSNVAEARKFQKEVEKKNLELQEKNREIQTLKQKLNEKL